ncbi:MAG: N-acetyl-gamma-glutamyl-phosphate reductase [Rhodothermales bacterium]|nr:N-acetyl-gamma-glutamyl-phosphate reductase [Rhodothermales bacterium]
MPTRVALLHGAGYTGGELIRLLLNHPNYELALVTSRSQAGEPVWKTHPHLRGQTELRFAESGDAAMDGIDAVFIAAEHGQSAVLTAGLLANGYQGAIVDLSSDFRLKNPADYDTWYGLKHPHPELIPRFQYGLAEVYGPYAPGTRFIANPGCFATGIELALWPIARRLGAFDAAITAITGASGSGAKPSATTHFPTRDGNVRAYKVLAHQHTPEIQQTLGAGCRLLLTPVSGPWVRGIWGTIQLTLPEELASAAAITRLFEEAYAGRPLVRLWPDELPELRYAVNTPFCDIGWVVRGNALVLGFAIDNLLKGASSQAIQNLNLVLGLPETAGLIPHESPQTNPIAQTIY